MDEEIQRDLPRLDFCSIESTSNISKDETALLKQLLRSHADLLTVRGKLNAIGIHLVEMSEDEYPSPNYGTFVIREILDNKMRPVEFLVPRDYSFFHNNIRYNSGNRDLQKKLIGMIEYSTFEAALELAQESLMEGLTTTNFSLTNSEALELIKTYVVFTWGHIATLAFKKD